MSRWLIAAFYCVGLATIGRAADQKNVLFVAVDDLRPAIAAAGDPYAITPNMDRLAKRGTVFTRAYCQQAVCSPSRSSLMTGCRPDTTKVWDLNTHFRKALPDVVTLAQHFKNQGYFSQGIGKIYHGGYNDEPSWSVAWEGPKGKNFGPVGLELMNKLRKEAKAKNQDVSKIRGLPVEAPEVDDSFLNDGSIADRAIELLGEFSEQEKPFFLAVGFAKPHLPFVAPKKYWDLYDPAKLPMPKTTEPPLDAPSYGPQKGGELRRYHEIPNTGTLSEETTRQLVHGYYAAVSFMDAQLGKILDELERKKLTEKTVILLWGDHGWHLGDHGIWCKHTNYEMATRSALIVANPGQKVQGQPCDKLVEFVDIYPTLCELCGLELPKHLEGNSFAPLLDDPKRKWKAAAFSQYPRSGGNDLGQLMGYAMRTERYRLVEWRKRNTTDVVSYELYDHQNDPAEDVNIAEKPQAKAILAELIPQLQAGWKQNKIPN